MILPSAKNEIASLPVNRIIFDRVGHQTGPRRRSGNQATSVRTKRSPNQGSAQPGCTKKAALVINQESRQNSPRKSLDWKSKQEESLTSHYQGLSARDEPPFDGRVTGLFPNVRDTVETMMHTELTRALNLSAESMQNGIPNPRLDWVDNLRTAMIFLVVNMHACVTYSHVGDWFITLAPEPSLKEKIPFILWQAHLQSFFMGLLFFIAGYFAEKSIVRKGVRVFIRERGMRLGLPTLFFMLVIWPLTVWEILGHPRVENIPQLLGLYQKHILSESFLSANGPLWFAFALLIFSLVFARFRGSPAGVDKPRPAPKARHFLLLCVGLVTATFVARLIFPVGTDFMNFQLCFFAQYIAGFGAGVLAARHGWLSSLADSPLAKWAGIAGLVGGPILLSTLIYFGGPPGPKIMPYAGGWHWQAFGLAFWEQTTGPALGLGLLYLFSRLAAFRNHTTHWLATHAFAVYVLHTPILVALALGLQPWHLTPWAGTLWLTGSGLIVSYAMAAVALKVPGLREIL